ncbi:MAG: hypothetical protein EA391_12790 [Balneolaceae bacterium]|nr:MAG: hypothetical protein EA391_12790 [Balneolaceae bacterium]
MPENEKPETIHLDPTGEITLSGKELMESPEMQKIAEDVIKTHNIELGPAQVGYLLVYPNISKQRAAKCMKATPEVKHYSGNDFLIEVSGDLWDMLDSDTKKMLLYHELLHIDPVFKAKNQEWQMRIRRPDFADYYEINDKFGNTWYKTIQATVSSLHDLDPKQESKVTV